MKERKVFLEKLPHSKSGKQIIWQKSVGLSFNFLYDGIKGNLKIIDYNKDNQNIYLEYNNNKYKTKTSDILKCRLSYIIGLKIREFKYNIGDIINFKTGDIKITKSFRNNKGKRYEYKCLNCGQYNEIQEYMIGITNNCPVCCDNPQKVVKGINDIATTDRWIVNFLKNKEDSYKYNRCSGKKITFKCPNCGFEKQMSISAFVSYGFSCPQCSDGFSMGNKFMLNILEQLNMEYESEKRFNWCTYYNKYKNKQVTGVYDFYIPINNLIIEMDGKQHKKENNKFKLNLDEQKYIDNKKDELAKIHNLNIIRIDCEYTDLNYIKNNILNSKLNKILDFKNINWDNIFENVINSKIKQCCDIFNKGKIVSELAIIFNVANRTIRSWLKQGNILNWCNYDAKIENLKAHKVKNNKSSKQTEIFKNKQSLGIFPSCAELERQSAKLFGVNLNHSKISMVCNGKKPQYKGFTFKYVNDEDNKKEIQSA